MNGRSRRSISFAGQYDLDAGDNDFEEIIGGSQGDPSGRAGLKRKRESTSPKLRAARPLRSRLRNGSEPKHDSGTVDGDPANDSGDSDLSNSRDSSEAEDSDDGHAQNRSRIVKLSIPRSSYKAESVQASDKAVSQDLVARQNSEPLVSSGPSDSDHEANENNHIDQSTCDAPDQVSIDRDTTMVNGDGENHDDDDRPRRSLRKGRRNVIESDEGDSSGQETEPSRRMPQRRSATTNEGKIDPDEEEYVELSEDADEQELMSETSSSPSRDDMHDFIEEDGNNNTRSSRRRRYSTRRAHRTRSQRTTSHRAGRRNIDSDDELSDLDGHNELQAELNDIRPPVREERRRQLRDRTNRPDYAIPPLLTDQTLTTTTAASSSRKRDPVMRNTFKSIYPEYSSLGLGLSANGQQTFGNFGPPVGLQSDSDSSDEEGQTNRSNSKTVAKALLPFMQNQEQSGTGSSNSIGKVKPANLADADPIGIDKEVSFDSVGGLSDHINQLKEMVSLPLLYPEIFQRFHITPPRGVLFHGPPGTGKTLMARALAASCSSEGRKISFYMRKGADCLSKWVGEAERQLRLLFEEARTNQPSIIFFDEIDGLAPVRSAKQDQIHASIVSTLLALMDGMDARGQVVVIGATNRPDSVDPALRRPGRFDREFYFPLPSLEARQQILKIHTSRWDPPLEAQFVSELAIQTKGYGGADLRALCTESALNAVQRRYPQIYQSSEKLVIDPTTIKVSPRDFMVAIKKLIPSSARSTASSASALPVHMQPLLQGCLIRAIRAVDSLVPRKVDITALEANLQSMVDDSTFEKEALRQMLDNIRIYRPRLLISGRAGSGQLHLGRAILHHLEGFHVQVLDLTTMFGDSSITAEASLIQTFVEAKRHMPSILFMPSIELWFGSASSSVVLILKSMLSTLAASDQLVLLGIANSERSELSCEISDLFGNSDVTNLAVGQPTAEERFGFFSFLTSLIAKSPAELPDSQKQRRRKLEKLAIAPPAPPRDPSKAERKAVETKDRKIKLILKAKLGPLMELIRSRYKRFKKPTIDEKDIAHLLIENGIEIPDDIGDRDYEKTSDGMILEKSTGKKFYNMDINLIEERLWSNLYLTPKQFQNDIEQILHDARQEDGDRERVLKAQELHTNVLIHLEDMFDAEFLDECKAMALREIERHQKYLTKKQAEVTADAARLDEEKHRLLQSQSDIHTLEILRPTSPIAEGETSASMASLQQANCADATRTNGTVLVTEELETSHEALDTEMTETRMTLGREAPLDGDRVVPNSMADIVTDHGNGVDISSNLIDSVPEVPPLPEPDQSSHTDFNEDEPEQEVEHPPFQLNMLQLEEKHKAWVNQTIHFDVERLEQVNALVIDAIWQQRFEWDRNKVVKTVDATFQRLQELI